MNTTITVIGAGPAGALTAAGLQRLGYAPLVLDSGRAHPVMEGVAARVVDALRYLGFSHTLATLSEPVPRWAEWNGERRSVNAECVVFRPEFNRGLRRDLEERGIAVRQGYVGPISADANGWKFRVEGDHPYSAHCDYLVDARGRSANRTTSGGGSGPGSLSIFQHWRIPEGAPATRLASVPEGWLWLTDDGHGNGFAQFTLATSRAKHLLTSNREQLIGRHLPLLDPRYATATARMPGGARGSTAIRHSRPLAHRYLRVGDAALAPDPLSGNGLFLAASTALIAPSVINTQLQRPRDMELAATFYEERLHHLYTRFNAAGEEFYRSETRWPDRTFWRERRCTPPANTDTGDPPETFTLQERAVVNHGWIERRLLPVNASHPLGIWKIDNRDSLRRRGAANNAR